MDGEKISIRSLPKMNVAKNIDGVLNEAGLSSVRQIIIQFNAICIILFSSYHTVLPYFAFAVPSWKCIEGNSSSSSEFCVQYSNRTITQSDSLFQQRCHLAHTEWRYATDRKYSFVSEFNLDCDHAYLAAIISSSFYVGKMCTLLTSLTYEILEEYDTV